MKLAALKARWFVAAAAVTLLAVACSDGTSGLTGGTEDDDTAGGASSSGGASSGGASSSGGSSGGSSAASALPCDVDAVLKTKCQSCHGASPDFGASVPLVTHADLTKAFTKGSGKVYEAVLARVKDAARPMPPQPNPHLADKDVATLESWVKAGAPSSTETCGGADVPSEKPLPCTADQTLVAAQPFTMQAGAPLDQYVCFGFDVNVAAKRHITALGPKVDNKKILHHILLFQTSQAYSTTPKACAAFGSASWKLVAGWAPGGGNLELPVEAGFPEEKGTTHWVVQLHYNNALNLPGATDRSGYQLCTTDKLRPNDAGVLAFGSTNFNLPPRATTAVTCDYTLNDNRFNGVKFFNASPHMHTRGLSMSTVKLAGGAQETIFDQPNFSFENQSNYPITKTGKKGDVFRTTCTYKNTGDTAVKFGEGTGDEMCFDFLAYYPAIPDQTLLGLPVFTWVTPSAGAKCTQTTK